MVEIGGRRFVSDIMNIVALHGITEFMIALGYRAEVIKQYFLKCCAVNNDISVDLASGATTLSETGFGLAPEYSGRIAYKRERVTASSEKPDTREGWINGCFPVLQARATPYIEDDTTPWERSAVERLGRDGQLRGYRHHGFCSCIDTLRESDCLEGLWSSATSPWHVWK